MAQTAVVVDKMRQTYRTIAMKLAMAFRVLKIGNVSKSDHKASVEETHTILKRKILALTHQLEELLEINSSNEYLIYTDTIVSQIPRSYAGHAFNRLQQAGLNYEILRLAALWDNQDDTTGILTIRPLLTDELIQFAALKVHDHYANSRPANNDPEFDEQYFGKLQQKYATEQSQKALEGLEYVVDLIDSTKGSHRFNSIINMRHKSIAHVADPNQKPKKQKPAAMKYGDEKWLLEASIDVVQTLYLWINGTSFDLRHAQEYAKRKSAAFWEGVTVKVKE